MKMNLHGAAALLLAVLPTATPVPDLETGLKVMLPTPGQEAARKNALTKVRENSLAKGEQADKGAVRSFGPETKDPDDADVGHQPDDRGISIEVTIDACFLESCPFCPDCGVMGLPDLELDLNADGVSFACEDYEDYYESLSNSECEDPDLQNFRSILRMYCRCPGYEPICPICPKGETVDPSIYYEFHDGRVTNCVTFELEAMLASQSTCDRYGEEVIDFLYDFCGCS